MQLNLSGNCRQTRFNEEGDPFQDDLKDVVPRVITELRKGQIGEYNASKAKAAISLVDGPDFDALFTTQLALDGSRCAIEGGLEALAKRQEDLINVLVALAEAGDELALDTAITKAIKVRAPFCSRGTVSHVHHPARTLTVCAHV